MSSFPFLAQRVLNTPLMITAPKAEMIMAAIGDRLGITRLARADGTVIEMIAPELEGAPEQERIFDISPDGVAIIPVRGTLVQRNGLHPYSGMTGYDGIRAKILATLDDPAVKATVLDIDSPGGEVAGVFDLADLVAEAAKARPIWAILNENACSAAYLLASACTRITVPRTGNAGSIGVIAILFDLSRMLDTAGVTVNVIQHGKRKADGNEYQALPKEGLERFQSDIDAIGELFETTVARYRGMNADKIRDMQAATFLGAAAVRLGLADQVAAPDEAFEALLNSL
jgi:signal peptide peptidase SppA